MYSKAKNVQIVIALLKAHNINQLVLSPGGTNAPFVRGVQDDPFFKCYSVVDERSALYFAIGIYLSTKKPVVACCTSAQATRNYLPGLTEAYYKHIPILAITFSKHPKYIGQDYMQAPNQTSLPVDSVKKTFALPYVSNEHDYRQCERMVNEAILALNYRVPGPIQLNVPMLDDELGADTEKKLPKVKVINIIKRDDIKGICILKKKILIVVGENVGLDDASIVKFCKINNAAIYVNQLSNMRNDFTVNGNLLLTVISDEKFDKVYCPDILITIGGQTGDYPLYYKLANCKKDYEHWRLSEKGDVVDTYDHLTKVIDCGIDFFFENIIKYNDGESGEYLSLWKDGIDKLKTDIDLPLSNAYIAQQMHHIIPEGSIVNFAILNSLRVWNLFPIESKVFCNSNVAAFGIDGCMSTFFGQSVITEKMCFMVIGDLSFFYDINSLGIRHIKNNVRILLVNNQGGIEFKYGGNSGTRKNVDRYIAAAGHFRDSCGWAMTNGFIYIDVRSKEDFMRTRQKLLEESPVPIIVEIFTKDEDEVNAYQLIRQANSNRSFVGSIKGGILRYINEL